MRLIACRKHYEKFVRTDDQNELEEKLAERDWLRTLGKLPGPLVALAFEEWTESKTYMPSPADIAKMARKRWRDDAQWVSSVEEKHVDHAYAPPELTEEDKARRKEIAERISAVVGARKMPRIGDNKE